MNWFAEKDKDNFENRLKIPFYRDRFMYISFLICFMLAFFSFIYFIWKGDGVLSILSDFNHQQVPFSMYVNDAIKTGALGWSWSADLGTSTLGAFSFYNLGSPFFWCSLIFPSTLFPFVVGWMYMLKYAVAGATAYLYIKRFTTTKKAAVFGAVLYAFSGFQTVNILFYHFHDVVAFFPLLLIGLEKLATEKKHGFFASAVFINCLLNYFFFIGEVVFLIIYFLCRFFDIKNIKLTMKILLSVIFEGILGVGMACVLFLPSIYFVIDSPRTSASIFGYANLSYDSNMYLQIIKGILLPGESLSAQSTIRAEDFTSKGAYLPAISISFVLAYCFKNKNWIRRLLIICLIFSLCPLLTRIFYVFSSIYWRWWYMPILIMAVASSCVVEKPKDYELKKAVTVNLLLIAAFVCYVSFLPWSASQRNGILRPQVFIICTTAAVICLFLIYFIKNNRHFFKIMIAVSMIMAIFTTSSMILIYRRRAAESGQAFYERIQLAEALGSYDYNYRFNTTDNLLAYIGGVHDIGNFNSTVSSSIFELSSAFDLYRKASSYFYTIPSMQYWLGAKYYLSDTYSKTDTLVDTLHYNGKTKYVLARDACPVSYMYDSYLLDSEFKNLDQNNRALASIAALIIPDDYEQTAAKYLKHLDVTKLQKDTNALENGIQKSVANQLVIKDANASSFSISQYINKDGYAFFSIPYDKGWSCTVDGVQTAILDTNGLMAVPIKAGTSNIVFTYETPMLREGIIVSLISWLVFIALLVFIKRKEKRHALKDDK